MGKLVCAHVNNLFSYPETLQDCINPTRPLHRGCLALEGQQKRLGGVCCFSVCGELFCVRGPALAGELAGAVRGGGRKVAAHCGFAPPQLPHWPRGPEPSAGAWLRRHVVATPSPGVRAFLLR